MNFKWYRKLRYHYMKKLVTICDRIRTSSMTVKLSKVTQIETENDLKSQTIIRR